MNFNLFQKIIIIIFFISFIIFFGSEVLMTQLAYSLFDIDIQGNFNFTVDKDEAFITIKNYALLNSYKISAYLLAFFTGLLTLIFYRKKVKESSNIFIIICFLFIAFLCLIPIYFYEVRLSMAIFMDGVNNFDDGSVNAFFIERFKSTAFSVLSGFSLLANLTAIGAFVLNIKSKIS